MAVEIPVQFPLQVFAALCFNLYHNQNGIFVETLKKKEDEETHRSHILYIYIGFGILL